jgi:DeoR/GlpR family transcriptional regulator of sugar metabolism
MDDAATAAALTPRHERILELLRRERVVEVSRLSEAFGVSSVTIRSDLDALERRRLLRRIRGGATAVQPARFERPLDLPSQSFAAEKERIGAMAARMVRDGETVILDAGTTACAMAMALSADLRDVLVITSSLDIAIALEAHAGVTVMVTGGTLKKTGRNRRSRSLIPPLAGLVLEQVNADCAYLCCAGIHAERGLHQRRFRGGGGQARHDRGRAARGHARRSRQDRPCRGRANRARHGGLRAGHQRRGRRRRRAGRCFWRESLTQKSHPATFLGSPPHAPAQPPTGYAR